MKLLAFWFKPEGRISISHEELQDGFDIKSYPVANSLFKMDWDRPTGRVENLSIELHRSVKIYIRGKLRKGANA